MQPQGDSVSLLEFPNLHTASQRKLQQVGGHARGLVGPRPGKNAVHHLANVSMHHQQHMIARLDAKTALRQSALISPHDQGDHHLFGKGEFTNRFPRDSRVRVDVVVHDIGVDLMQSELGVRASLGSELPDNTLPLGGSRGTSGEGWWRPGRALRFEPCRAAESSRRETLGGGEPALAIDPVLAGRGPLTPGPSPPQSRGRGEPGSKSFAGHRSGALPEKH